MPKRITPVTLPRTWLRLSAYVADLHTNCRQEPDVLRAFCDDLGAFLDILAEQDAFGTEGQCDPRGDQRN